MRKKLTIFATLIVALALGFASQALGWESTAPESLPEEGVFYLYNVGQGKYLHQGGAWGTHAVLEDRAYALNIVKNSDGKLKVQPLKGNNWLGSNAYMDNGSPCTITPSADGNGAYYLTNEDGNKLVFVDGTITWSADATGNDAAWQIYSADQLKAGLADATEEAPLDATFLIQGPRVLANNNEMQNSWTGIAPGYKTDAKDGNSYWTSAELWNKDPFEYYQTITLPKGVYKLTVDAYYRYGNKDAAIKAYLDVNNKQNVVLFADDAVVPVRSITDADEVTNVFNIVDSQTEGGKALHRGSYVNELVFSVDADNTEVKIGLKKDEKQASDWLVFDNFTLTYYGTEADEATLAAEAIKANNAPKLAKLKALSESYKEVAVTDELKASFDEAIAAIEAAISEESVAAAKEKVRAAAVADKLSFGTGLLHTPGVVTYDYDASSNGTIFYRMAPVTGWDFAVTNANACAGGVFAYGSGAWLGGTGYNPPATNPDGEAKGNALGLVAVWSGSVRYSTSVELKAGAYIAKFKIQNTSGTTAFIKNCFGFINNKGTASYGTTVSFPEGEWKEETVKFYMPEDGIGTLTAGYDGANSNGASSQHLFLDCVTIEPDPDAADITALKAAIENANAKLGFEIGEYSPIVAENAAAMELLVKAQNMLLVGQYDQAVVDAAKEELEAATWTPNTERTEAVYNGDFSACKNDEAFAAWKISSDHTLGGSGHSRAFVLTEGMNNYGNLAVLQPEEGTRSCAFMRFDGSSCDRDSKYIYGCGETWGTSDMEPSTYIMPLHKGFKYQFSCDFGQWGGNPGTVCFSIIDAAGETVAYHEYATETAKHRMDQGGGEKICPVFSFYPTVDGNCSIVLNQKNTDQQINIIITNISVKRIKEDQTISWDQEFEALQEGSEVEFTATASSGLDVAYELVDPTTDVATLEGNKLTFLKGGSVQVKATQEGNDDFNAAEPVVQTIMAGAVAKSLADVVKMDPTTPFFVGFDVTVVYSNNYTYVYDGTSYYMMGNTPQDLEAGEVILKGWRAEYNPDAYVFYPTDDETLTFAEEKVEVPSPVKLTPEANAFDYVRTVNVNVQTDEYDEMVATTSDGMTLPIFNMFYLDNVEAGQYNLVGFVYKYPELGGGGDDDLLADGDDADDDAMAVEPGSYPFAFVPISIEPFVQYLPDGKYFFYNVGQNGYLHQGGAYGTRSVLTPYAYALEVSNNEYNGTLTVNTVNGGFFGNDNYMDKTGENAKAVITLTKNEAGNFTITNADGDVFGFNAEKNQLAWGESADSEWKILSAAELEAALADATATSTMDATFFLNGPRLLINNNDFQNSWSYGDTKVNMGTGDKYKDGNSFWTAAEVYNAPVDFHQTVKLAKGTYKLELDGFYRFGNKADALAAHNGGTEQIKAVMYAGEDSEPLMSIFDAEGLTDLNSVVDDLITASKALASGKYSGNALYFNVPEAGEVTLGVKNAENADKDWTVFNNFRLTYYGAETTVDEAKAVDQAAVVLAELQEMLKKAQEAKAAAEAEAVANAYEAAIVAINDAIAEQTDANVEAAKAALAAADAAAERYAGLEEMLATAKLYASQTADEDAKTALGAAVTALEAALAAPADDEKFNAAETAYKAGVDAIPTSEYLNFQIGTVVTPGVVTYKKDAAANGTEYYNEVAVAGWEIPANGDGPASGLMAYGSDAWLGGTGFTVPATNPEGKAEGNALGMVSCWSASVNYLMPYEFKAGKYRIDFKIMNINGTDEFAKNLFGFIDEDGVEHLATAKSYKEGEWVTESVEFELTDDMAGNISIGYVAPDAGSKNAQRLFLDNVTITKVEEPVEPELKEQTITWDQTFTDVKLNEAVTLNATASSGLEVTYALKAANEKVTLNAASLTFTDYTSVVVVASQAGNDEYAAAESVEKTIECVASGIARILADDPDARFFNLDGHQVKNPQPDKLYIVIKNGKAFKAIVK